MVDAGNPLTVATAERYKIRANSFPGLQVTDRMRDRVSVDYTVTSSQIRNLERKPRWMKGWIAEYAEGQGGKKKSESHEAGEG